ncbi:MAG: translation initiation factor IF-2 [Deltaproteobacteria bacterium]|nr:translation initiation factor IF-2 [Deltaproteobacteria bacterium]
MGKIRIYELARDLNMTNKQLLEKLEELGIPAKSHMSSFEESEVEGIKAKIHGKKQPELVEKRIRPSVIRRRKVKKVVEEPSAAEPEPPKEAEAESPEKAEPVAEDTAAEGEVQEAAMETEATEAAAATDETAAAPEKPEEEAAAPEAEQETKKEVQAEAPEEPSEEAPTAPGDEPAVETPSQPKEPKKKAAKLRKKETPAKIIKLPTKPVPPPPEKASAVPDGTPPPPQRPDNRETPTRAKKKKGRKAAVAAATAADGDKKFFKKKISFMKKEVVEGKDLYSSRGKRGRKGRKGGKTKLEKGLQTQITTPKAIKRRIKIDDTIVLAELAKRMGIKANEMIAKLMSLGVMATVNQTIDFDTAVLVSAEFGYELEKASFEEEIILKTETDDPENLAERPPVVTIMGHVDHGKTSLLDVIRKTRVTELEAGGITQHIGAYNVSTSKGHIVFLDTPGHEAFSAMRSRGARVTDIVILVVAADDGVMPQTVEAINHSKAAGVPIIVAVNKIDKANAEPERVQRELAENGLVPEDWGGDTIFVTVSAKQNTGIDTLLEMVLLQAEMLELKANPDKLARGHVVEAKLDAGRGPVATVLVQEGTLHAGDPVVCGIHHGKVRALLNDRGLQVKSAGPSIPVEIIGLSGVPQAGDEMISLADEKDAKQVSLHRMQKQRSLDLAKTGRLSLEGLFEKLQEGEVKDLNIILKADVHGSIEALRDSLSKLSNEEVKINIVHAATGAITESDISLATVSDSIIVGFNIRPTAKIQDLAEEEHVDIRYHNVIYDVIKEIQNAILGMMSSIFEDRTLGWAEVRDIFHIPKVGAIAGCYVTDGKFERGQKVRLVREGVVIYDGKIGSLRRFKDDVKEVQSGYECGIGIENFNDIKLGDTIECYFTEEIRPELD